ncbi:MAG: hypothetical protein WD751_06985 [Anaerolineales bacterium]
MKHSKKEIRRAVHKALRQWDQPTRAGLETFAQMKLPREFGFEQDLPIVECRLTINKMLLFYIDQLGRLQPDLAKLLTLRFAQKAPVKKLAFQLSVSIDQVNRLQRIGITFLAGLVYDEERRRSSPSPDEGDR